MEYPFYPVLEEETKLKIAAIVEAGHGFVLMNYAVNFLKNQNDEMFKAAVDRAFRIIFTRKLSETASFYDDGAEKMYIG